MKTIKLFDWVKTDHGTGQVHEIDGEDTRVTFDLPDGSCSMWLRLADLHPAA